MFDTNILLFVQVSVGIWLSNKEDRERVYRLYHHLCSSATLELLDWLLSRNLKPRFKAFSDFPRKLDLTKITRHMVYLKVTIFAGTNVW